MRYLAAAIQTDFPNPPDRSALPDRVVATARHDRPRRGRLRAVRRRAAGRVPRVRPRRAGLRHGRGAARQARGRRSPTSTPTATIAKAKRARTSTSRPARSWKWTASIPGCVFNTTCLIGPDGLLYKYRKVHPWIPWEVHASPHDIPDYAEPLFPVAETEIGALGCAICYDWLFPEAIRELALQGAEVLVRVSAYMDPWGATPPMDWWTVVNRCRALENMAYVVAANQGREPDALPAVLLAGRQHGRRLRRPHPGPGRPRPRREDRRRPDRPRGAARRTRTAHGPPHARPPPQRGLHRPAAGGVSRRPRRRRDRSASRGTRRRSGRGRVQHTRDRG